MNASKLVQLALLLKLLLDKNNDQTIFPEKNKEFMSFCGVGCQTLVSVKDNKIVAVDGQNGPANENRLCVKGRFGFDYINSPLRLTTL